MKRLLLLTLVTAMLSSCATIFTGTKDTIHFNSNPEGATVYKDGLEICKTPCRVPVKRSLNDTDIEYRLDGYEARVFSLDKEFNVVSIINLGNLLGWGIDAASGALMKYDRKNYELDLKRDERTSNLNPKEIHINSEKNTVDIYVIAD
ncbi:PEGA domain-containing protein [Litoribacter ruber]|uniref:PEGA domain-containing protein n=1 Tax=Litoribacter ruber TaxID=702568 RepID=A0AAP2G1P1_9BACT|nr:MULTISPECIES: PEGA domain-containing protein [Litoribacter]MBS9524497.1 PEGA domain-containing protein [Litoribacter alkaliphilus]MBT0810333.1 PEGA domain-containing protein [Litoribacter ruber]